jgi:hypothetical protein
LLEVDLLGHLGLTRVDSLGDTLVTLLYFFVLFLKPHMKKGRLLQKNSSLMNCEFVQLKTGIWKTKNFGNESLARALDKRPQVQ